MSAKKTIYPPSRDAHDPSGPEGLDDLYTGHPGYDGMDLPTDGETPPRGRGKGHAAYAAQDEMPPHEPESRGFSLGGLFTGQSHAEPKAPPHGAGGLADEALAAVNDDDLRAACEKRLCPACPAKKDADDLRLRSLADLDNARKRLTREHEEQARFAAEGVLSDIIPSLDNLDLALQHASDSPACKDFVTGVRMTRKLLAEALAKHGLEEVGGVGEEFNPAVHEAVGMIGAPDVPDNHVCALLARGYRLRERLLRPARVMVCKKD